MAIQYFICVWKLFSNYWAHMKIQIAEPACNFSLDIQIIKPKVHMSIELQDPNVDDKYNLHSPKYAWLTSYVNDKYQNDSMI